MTEDQILQVFVNANNSTKMQEITKSVAEQWKLMEDVFESAATEIKPRYAKLMNQKPKEVVASDDDNEEEGE